MSFTPFIGQLMPVGFNFAPKNWALCNGQILPINQNQALFSLLGTSYGGDGRVTFGLPNLQGRTPISIGNGFIIGQVGGETAHTLTIAEVPAHTHTVNAAGSGGNNQAPAGALLAGGGPPVFASATNLTAMNSGTIALYGGSQPHENQQPYLVITWCISLVGVFPSPA